MKNKIIVFITSTVLLTTVLALLVGFVVPSKKYDFPLEPQKMNITIVGDSLFCNISDYNLSLAEYLADKTGCEMQNCSIGGTTAVKLNNGKEVDYYSDKLNFYNISNMICSGNISTVTDDVKNLSVIFPDSYVKIKFLVGTDMDKEDYLIVCYGINDAFMRIPAKSDDPYDENTYSGAIRRGVERINKKYPDLKIILCEQTASSLIQNKEADEYFDSVTADYKKEYNDELKKISEEYNNVYFFEVSDTFSPANPDYEKYFSDGIHLNGEGKDLYSSQLAEFIGELE